MIPLVTTSTLFVYLVVRGDVESHRVLSAHLSPEQATKRATDLMVADDDFWSECPAKEGETEAWEVTRGPHRGRLFGYFAIECFQLEEDDGEWTCTYEPAAAENPKGVR